MKKNSKNLNLKIPKKVLPKYPSILGRSSCFNSAILIPLVKVDGKLHLLFQKERLISDKG